MGDKGIVASTAGLAILLNEGIGDTIRVSLTPEPGRRPRARGRDRPAGPPVDGAPLVPAPGQRLSRLRPDDLDVLPGDGPADPGPPEGPDAGVAGDPPRRRGDAGRGHGLRRQRPGRVEARRHRDLACRARSRTRSRRSSSTAGSTGRSAARASSTSSSTSSRPTSTGAIRPRRPPSRHSVWSLARRESTTPPVGKRSCPPGSPSTSGSTIHAQPCILPRN